MAINFISFSELFAPEYQLTYISTDGHISVGPHTYSVFHYYTMIERQVIFQVCKKYLPWEYTEIQEQWEQTMYMYQFVIKSPPPFPYLEYLLSEDIIMAITWEVKITPLDVLRKEASIRAIRTNDIDGSTQTFNIITAILDTQQQKIDVLNQLWQMHLDYDARQILIDNYIGTMESDAKTNLEGRE